MKFNIHDEVISALEFKALTLEQLPMLTNSEARERKLLKTRQKRAKDLKGLAELFRMGIYTIKQENK